MTVHGPPTTPTTFPPSSHQATEHHVMPFMPTDLFPEFKRGNTAATVRPKLARMAKELSILKRELLESLRQRSRQLDHPMFLWRALLQSFATMGGASGWAGLV